MTKIIDILTKKLDNPNSKYNDKEIKWLISHVGDPDSDIRDALVCNTFGSSFFEEKFTREQAKHLFETVQQKNLLFYQIPKKLPYTLTRSFICLLLELIILVNGKSDSKYYQILCTKDELATFDSLIKYLELENDYTGYSNKYGWVHSVAHCSDALEICIKQNSFDQKLATRLLMASQNMFLHVNKRFIDEEEYHLADVFIAGIKRSKFSSNDLIQWFDLFDFNLESLNRIDFYRFCNLKSFAEDIYVKLNTDNLLNNKLAKYIEEKFSQKY